MFCPFCQAEETKVIDSRLVTDGAQVKRRRQCLKCNERFTTFESAELMMPLVIKRDGRREAFNVESMRSGMLKALEKRPVGAESIEQAVVSILQSIRRQGEREIEARWLGELVMAEVYKLDHVAYIRFASVYKRFKDVSEFRETIEQLKNNGTK